MKKPRNSSLFYGLILTQLLIIAFLLQGHHSNETRVVSDGTYEPLTDQQLGPMTSNSTDYEKYENPDRLIEIDTNSQGFRDEEWSDKTHDTVRAAFIGDSWTYGYRVNESNRYEHLLEAELNNNTEKEIDFLNMGIPGLGAIGKVRFAKEYAIPANTDVILIQLLDDDLVNNTRIYNERKERYKEEGATSESEKFAISQEMEKERQKRINNNLEKYTEQLLRTPLKDLGEVSEESEIPVCVFYIVREGGSPSREDVERIVEDEGLEYLEVGQKYVGLPERRRFDGGTHPTRYGNRMLAQILHLELTKNSGKCSRALT